MNCEICGKPISGKPLRTKIDGSVLEVCKECAKFGRVQKAPPTPIPNRTTKKNTNNVNKRQKYQKKQKDDPVDEIVEDYNTLVRKARESKGWSREELGEKIYEKVSVINRIESGKMEPDLKLAKKLEKNLNIKLIEKVDNIDLESFRGTNSKGNTIGSIVKIKRK